MTKFEQLDSMLEQGNGYITTRAVTAQGISKPYFAEYARSRELERVAHGVYQSRDAWPDDMYVLHLRNSNIIFSHQSALALHGMMEREPHHIICYGQTGLQRHTSAQAGRDCAYSFPGDFHTGADLCHYHFWQYRSHL